MNWFFRQLMWCVLFSAVAVMTISFWFTISFLWVFNPLIFVAIIVVLLGDISRAVLAAVIFGVLFDLFSALPFGIGLISFVATVVVIFFFQQTLFKQQAIHTMVIHTIIGTWVFHLLFWILCWSMQKIGLAGADITITPGHVAMVASVQSGVSVFCIIVIHSVRLLFQKVFIRHSV